MLYLMKSKGNIEFRIMIQVFAEVIPEYLVMYGEVCSEDLLLLLLQIDVQGYLDHKNKDIISVQIK